MAAHLHQEWLERNPWAQGGDLDVPYQDLPEAEKAKDREHIEVYAQALARQH